MGCNDLIMSTYIILMSWLSCGLRWFIKLSQSHHFFVVVLLKCPKGHVEENLYSNWNQHAIWVALCIRQLNVLCRIALLNVVFGVCVRSPSPAIMMTIGLEIVLNYIFGILHHRHHRLNPVYRYIGHRSNGMDFQVNVV